MLYNPSPPRTRISVNKQQASMAAAGLREQCSACQHEFSATELPWLSEAMLLRSDAKLERDVWFGKRAVIGVERTSKGWVTLLARVTHLRRRVRPRLHSGWDEGERVRSVGSSHRVVSAFGRGRTSSRALSVSPFFVALLFIFLTASTASNTNTKASFSLSLVSLLTSFVQRIKHPSSPSSPTHHHPGQRAYALTVHSNESRRTPLPFTTRQSTTATAALPHVPVHHGSRADPPAR